MGSTIRQYNRNFWAMVDAERLCSHWTAAPAAHNTASRSRMPLHLFGQECCGQGPDQEVASKAGSSSEKAAVRIRSGQLIQTQAEGPQADDSDSDGLNRCKHGTFPSLDGLLLCKHSTARSRYRPSSCARGGQATACEQLRVGSGRQLLAGTAVTNFADVPQAGLAERVCRQLIETMVGAAGLEPATR